MSDINPISPPPLDDTQPNPPIEPPHTPGDTQPITTTASRRWLLIIIVITLISLALSVTALIVFSDDAPTADTMTITINISGDTQTITTTAQTVADVLQAQNITIAGGDVVNPGLLTPIEDGMTIELNQARTVSLTVDGVTSVLRTTLDMPDAILRSAGITLRTADRILLDGTQADIADLVIWPVPVTNITIERAIAVTIIDGDSTIRHETTSDTVGEAVVEAGVELFLADTISPELSATLTPEMQIIVDRSRPITVVADGSRIETRTASPTVGTALAEVGVILAGLDYVVPAEDETILPGMSIRVIRVTEERITEDERIPHTTVYQADPALDLDRRQVIQAGQDGIQRRSIVIRYENGVEVSRTVEDDTLVNAVVEEIIAYGTNVVIRTIQTPNGPVEYWRRLSVYATSYHPAALGGDNITATGAILQNGVVAADPRIIPYYTNVYVNGYGVGEILDTGGPRTSPYWIDLGYTDADFVGWSRLVEVYLLTPVPDNINYLLPSSYRGGTLP